MPHPKGLSQTQTNMVPSYNKAAYPAAVNQLLHRPD
jgi:hypothetical protein